MSSFLTVAVCAHGGTPVLLQGLVLCQTSPASECGAHQAHLWKATSPPTDSGSVSFSLGLCLIPYACFLNSDWGKKDFHFLTQETAHNFACPQRKHGWGIDAAQHLCPHQRDSPHCFYPRREGRCMPCSAHPVWLQEQCKMASGSSSVRLSKSFHRDKNFWEIAKFLWHEEQVRSPQGYYHLFDTLSANCTCHRPGLEMLCFVLYLFLENGIRLLKDTGKLSCQGSGFPSSSTSYSFIRAWISCSAYRARITAPRTSVGLV